MEITPRFRFVEGSFDTLTNKMLVIGSDNHGTVELCSNKEDLLHWYSLEDAQKLLENGFVFTRYLAIDYHEYENETVFLKETSLSREEINILALFKEKGGEK